MVCMLKFLLLSAALVSNQMSSSCVEILRGYMANTNRANWQLVAQFVAADAIVQLQRRRRRKPIRRLLRDRRQLGEYFTLVRDMRNGDGTDFFQYFRMSVERFDRLVELLRPLIEPRRSTVVSLSAGEKLAFTLRYLAHGSTMRIIAKSYRISDSMAGRIVRQTCLALRQVLEPLYLPHPTAADWRRIAAEFEREWNFPNCIGAIDGKHIDIEAPGNSGSLFHNYKGTFSTVLLAVCDAKYRFTLVDIGGCGSRGDTGLFNDSDFGKKLKAGHLSIPQPRQLPGTSLTLPYVMVGDEAFPLSENLMRPFPGANLNSERRIFNYRLSRARRIVENAFGVLANRWRIVRQDIRASTTYWKNCSAAVTNTRREGRKHKR